MNYTGDQVYLYFEWLGPAERIEVVPVVKEVTNLSLERLRR